MWKKKEGKKEEKEESLLKELCGDDAKLYDFLSHTSPGKAGGLIKP